MRWVGGAVLDIPHHIGPGEGLLERISITNYVIDFCAKEGHLFVRYANARETGPSVSVWMVPVK